jgi:hypothetical protein
MDDLFHGFLRSPVSRVSMERGVRLAIVYIL